MIAGIQPYFGSSEPADLAALRSISVILVHGLRFFSWLFRFLHLRNDCQEPEKLPHRWHD